MDNLPENVDETQVLDLKALAQIIACLTIWTCAPAENEHLNLPLIKWTDEDLRKLLRTCQSHP